MAKIHESEWLRSLFHLGSGITIALLYYLAKVPKNYALIILGAIALFFVVGDIFRHFLPRIDLLAKKIFAHLMREHEKTRIAASSCYVIGCWLTILFFDREIAVICILLLAICDIASKMLRKILKKEKNLHRFLKIVALNFSIGFVITYFMLRAANIGNPFLLSFFGAAGVSTGEMIPKIDNLTIPLFGGILLALGLYFIG